MIVHFGQVKRTNTTKDPNKCFMKNLFLIDYVLIDIKKICLENSKKHIKGVSSNTDETV